MPKILQGSAGDRQVVICVFVLTEKDPLHREALYCHSLKILDFCLHLYYSLAQTQLWR